VSLRNGLVAFDRRQQRLPWLAFVVAVVKKATDDEAGQLAALIAYYAFFSLFPLLLAMVTILGFVLHGDPSAQASVEHSVLGQFPIINSQIKLHRLTGSTPALVLGVVGAIWAGLAVTNAAERAFDRVWAVPRKDRAGFVGSRLRGIAVVITLGSAALGSSVASGLVSGGVGGAWLVVGGIVVSLAINTLLFFAAYRLLTSAPVSWRCLRAGALTAAIFWEALQIGGGLYVGHVIKGASATGGLFALVLGLLAFLHLAALSTVYAAEINVVLERRLWPRSLLEPSRAEDHKTLEALAKTEERSELEHIEVEFDPVSAKRPDV
jgi:membrane protein